MSNRSRAVRDVADVQSEQLADQTHDVAQRGPSRTGTRKTAILGIICISYFMVILDNSIIFTGLPSIQASMHFGATGLTWVQNAYTLVFGGLLLLGARAGDILGRRRMFVWSLVVFGSASFLVGIAPLRWWLIAARAFQGVGAAILAPSALALLTATFTESRERGRAVAAYSAVAGIGASAGLVVGGVLADWISWRAGFFLNVPIGMAMLLAALRILKREPPTQRGRFDVRGALFATLGMTAVVFGVINAAESGWGALSTIGSLLVGALLLSGLVLNEARAEQPIMPLRLFADRQRVGAYLTRLLFLGAMIGFFFFTTQYLQDVLGFSPLQAGFAFLPMSAMNFAVAVLVTRIIGRIGATPTLIVGVAVTLAGMVWLSRVELTSGYLSAVAPPMVLIGIGQGLAFAPMTSAGLHQVAGPDAGASSGLVNTFHQLGSAVGLSVLAALGAAAASATAAPTQAVVQRVTAALTGGSVLLSIALGAVVTLIATWRSSAAESAPLNPVKRTDPSSSTQIVQAEETTS
ncbi:MFS transporter [Nocardioides mangrovicus]|uniref:MFS transporter n=1 Tax=Nocardioides mangrovicus TaxID=2478913 RepID=A0A3L8P463_9ACTN|nr:MFS transporter [Nocardioides mangrovicus]RLV49827.1 MFS transporter [Nocardioides mangrovicus]